jgi:hypothetical protein
LSNDNAQYEAARILKVQLTPARQAGYDATEQKAGIARRLQDQRKMHAAWL